MQFPVFIRLHRSSFVAWAGVGIYLLGAIFVAITPLPLWGKTALLASVTLFGLLGWKQYQTCLKQLNFNLVLYEDGSLAYLPSCTMLQQQPNTTPQPLTLRPGSLVHPWLSILAFTPDITNTTASTETKPKTGKTYQLVLTPDSLSPDDFRYLRVWLLNR